MRVVRRLISLNLKGRSSRNIPLFIIRQKSHQTFGTENRNRNNNSLTSQGIVIRRRVLVHDRRTLRATNRRNRA